MSLRRYGYDERAGFLDRLAEDPDEQHLAVVASGSELWGGAGAVWEVEPFQYSAPGEASSEADCAEFQRAMIRIAELLQRRGIDARARRNADLFRREAGGS